MVQCVETHHFHSFFFEITFHYMLNALTNLQVEQRMQRLIGNNLFYASSSCLFLAFSVHTETAREKLAMQFMMCIHHFHA